MRKIIIILSFCIGLLLLGYSGYRGYQVWKQSHGMAMARAFFAKGDSRNTILSLQAVLHTNPRNIDACRMIAGLEEAVRDQGSLVWRERVLEINPKSFQDRLALVQAALIFKDYALASNTLAGVTGADKNTADYNYIAGNVSLLGGQLDDAEAHFSEAIRLDPSNPVPQMSLAVVRLHRTNALDMAEARITLQRVIMNSTNAALCSQARRELVYDAMRFNNIPTALTLSKELAQQTNSVFDDKLLRLYVLLKINSDEFAPTLASYQREAATDSKKLFAMANWQMQQLSANKALGWLQSLPMQTRTNKPACLLAAQCQLDLGDWHGLQAALQQQNWDELEFMRHAFLARALRGQGLEEASTAEWGVALKSASGSKGSRKALFDLAAQWRWNTEAEQILWTVVEAYPEEKGAAATLTQYLVAGRRTRSLMELSDIMFKRNPDDLDTKNDLAMTAMLLGEQELDPYDLAREVYEKAPANPSFASTYAFSLYLQGKYPEALKVMQQLAPKDLQNPSIDGYYGLILKANGNMAGAKSFLDRSSGGRLLPEEQALFNQAKVGL
jgi:cytochrome c-type biogenesis protein CcmH/NrfG